MGQAVACEDTSTQGVRAPMRRELAPSWGVGATAAAPLPAFSAARKLALTRLFGFVLHKLPYPLVIEGILGFAISSRSGSPSPDGRLPTIAFLLRRRERHPPRLSDTVTCEAQLARPSSGRAPRRSASRPKPCHEAEARASLLRRM